MSKTLLAPVAIVLALALAACGGSAPADSADAPPADSAAPATDTAAPPADPAAPAAPTTTP
jgi:ABC-type glycerol-3-phosphate transport system substrate-binding protein